MLRTSRNQIEKKIKSKYYIKNNIFQFRVIFPLHIPCLKMRTFVEENTTNCERVMQKCLHSIWPHEITK